MAENSKIEWTDHTFNPWVGCTKVSPACDHCYAEGWAKRAGKAAGVVWGGERRRTSVSTWRQPLKWERAATLAEAGWRSGLELVNGDEAQLLRSGFAKPRRPRVFCASLADVFDNQVPDEWRADLFTLIAKTPHLDWLLLTKRIGNVQKMLSDIVHSHDEGLSVLDMMEPDGGWYRNVWLGATICNQPEADRDIGKLQDLPAAVRFLSIEPMLGPIDLTRVMRAGSDGWTYCDDALRGFRAHKQGGSTDPGRAINWVICGGESGPKARPMHPDWARSLRDQCAAAGVPFRLKQWGEWVEADRDGDIVTATEASGIEVEARRYDLTTVHGAEFIRVGKKAAGRLLDGREHNEFPGV